MDVVWGETAGVKGQLLFLCPVLFILQVSFLVVIAIKFMLTETLLSKKVQLGPLRSVSPFLLKPDKSI